MVMRMGGKAGDYTEKGGCSLAVRTRFATTENGLLRGRLSADVLRLALVVIGDGGIAVVVRAIFTLEGVVGAATATRRAKDAAPVAGFVG